MAATKETIDALERQLLNTTGDVPLHSRYRALFTLKSLKSEAAIAVIAKGESLFFVKPYLTDLRRIRRRVRIA